VDRDVVRNLRVERRLLSLCVFVPEFIDTVKGLLRHLNPKSHVVGQLSFGDWKWEEGSYEEPRSVEDTKIFVLLYPALSLLGWKRSDSIRSAERQFKVVGRVLVPAFGADGHDGMFCAA
jgi:hypothetical protein